MSRALTATPWRTDGNAPDMTKPFSDEAGTVFLSAWPRRFHQDFTDDLSAPSAVLPTNRRMMPEVPDDEDEPASSSTNTNEKKKKTDKPSSSDNEGAPKKKKPVKKPDPPAGTDPKKPRDDSVQRKKNKPVEDNKPDDSGSGTDKQKPTKPLPPQVNDIKPEPEPEPSVSGADEVPPDPPVVETGSLPPEPEPDPEPELAEEIGRDTPIAKIDATESNLLTDEPVGDVMGERSNTDGSEGFFSKVGNFFKDFLDGIFPEKTEVTSSDPSYIPVALPPPRNPSVETNPVESFRAGYISQRDLESVLGRDDWTMCCATTFVYAVQSKYPGLDRDKIYEAAGKAANTPLADGSGNCVSTDGYVSSVYQYSQALSKNLGLKDYVDTPGQYPTVEAARKAGVEMMKVELSGTAGDIPQEHHVIRIRDAEIDPVEGDGIDDLWDDGSRKVESVMALDWYTLP